MNEYKYSFPMPCLTSDVVIIKNGKILLIERGREKEPFYQCWAIPGGFVNQYESPESAAARELLEETNLNVIDLEKAGAVFKHFGIYGKEGRDPRGWVVSCVYVCVVPCDVQLTTIALDDAKSIKWFDLHRLPQLAFDHEEIITDILKKGIESL